METSFCIWLKTPTCNWSIIGLYSVPTYFDHIRNHPNTLGHFNELLSRNPSFQTVILRNAGCLTAMFVFCFSAGTSTRLVLFLYFIFKLFQLWLLFMIDQKALLLGLGWFFVVGTTSIALKNVRLGTQWNCVNS